MTLILWIVPQGFCSEISGNTITVAGDFFFKLNKALIHYSAEQMISILNGTYKFVVYHFMYIQGWAAINIQYLLCRVWYYTAFWDSVLPYVEMW